MCGIAGEIALAAAGRTDITRADGMLDTILHRGPDGRGAWQDARKRVALTHCRLAIVDVEHGDQPMLNNDGQIAICYNGEVYGFEDHRRALSDDYRFRTRSDTEVLIAMYLREGPGFVERLEGEFAFVLYDGRNGRTLMARDRFGIKPLFYSRQGDLLLFGSEIKALLAHPQVARAIAPAPLFRRMHGVMLPEETIFEGVEALAPGTMMVIEPTGEMRTHRHADLDPLAAGTLHMSRDAATDAFEEGFTAAVKDRLQGDVPVGIYLSGGVDSSTLATVMREITGDPIEAFTIGFRDRDFGEAEDAAATAATLGMGHHVEAIGPGDLDGDFARSLWHGETPVMNAHGTAKMRLSGRTSTHVKVVLAGEGADEIHGGYSWHRHAGLLQEANTRARKKILKSFTDAHCASDGVLRRATPRLRSSLAGEHDAGVPYAAMRASLLNDMMGRLFHPDFTVGVDPDPARQLLDWLAVRSPDARRLDDATLSRMVSAITDLPTYNFSYLGDRAEMANSVEGRLPFLDRRVADLLWRLPADFHIGATSNKTVIRAALARRKHVSAERFKRIFLAPSTATSGVFAGPMAQKWLSKEAIEAAGIFRYRPIAILRMVHAALPRSASARVVVESLFMMVISAHLLDHMFCKDFAGSLEKFAMKPAKPARALEAA